MFYIEQELSESDVYQYFQEMITDPENLSLREQVLNPIISVLNNKEQRSKYIAYGYEFLDANSEMLSKEFPTTRVTFPIKYIDKVLELFGFTVESLREILRELIKTIRDDGTIKTIIANPSNVIHATALFYSDIIISKDLRDSARYQLGLSVYANIFNKYYPVLPNVSVMTYTYLHLDGSWGLVKAENVINWITNTIESCYQFWRSKLALDMNLDVLTQFLSRVRTSFNQNVKMITQQYHMNLDNGNLIGDDLQGSEDYVETKNFKPLRDNLIRLIRQGDRTYKTKNDVYEGIAKLKNVKCDSLFEFAQRIDYKDIATIIDDIFYVFLVREGNTVKDINTSKYIGRITNFPTAIDRAITGMPVILPLSNKYEIDSSIVKAYICFLATFIMQKINQVQ